MHVSTMKTRQASVSPTSWVSRRGVVSKVVCLVLFVHMTVARGQLLERATVIADARIITGGGQVIEKASIVIKGGKIVAVGENVKVPFLSRRVSAAGKTITPGLIDVWSALGMSAGTGDGDATARAEDAFDRYARDDFREALRQGVTTVYVGADGSAGINGTAAVIQLVPGTGRSAGEVLRKDAALCVNLGSNQSPIRRIKTFASIRKQFQTAVDYRKSLEDYDEDLKEYLDKLAERRKKDEGEKKTDEGAAEDEKSPEDESPSPQSGDDIEGDDSGGGGAGGLHGHFRAIFPQTTGRSHFAKSGSNGDKPKGGDKAKSPEDQKDKDKEDELKKPQKPAYDAVSVVLLRAIDHELEVRIEAHRSADILNALALAKEFHLDIVLEGATEAYLVADAIAEADVAVVLGQVERTGIFEDTEFRRHTNRNAEYLSRAGVRWAIGSGGHDPRASRFLGFNAEMALAHLPADDFSRFAWVEWLTRDASELLGMSQEVGLVAPSMRADLVIWSGDPGDPQTIVERVFVGGTLAYLAPGLAGGGL